MIAVVSGLRLSVSFLAVAQQQPSGGLDIGSIIGQIVLAVPVEASLWSS